MTRQFATWTNLDVPTTVARLGLRKEAELLGLGTLEEVSLLTAGATTPRTYPGQWDVLSLRSIAGFEDSAIWVTLSQSDGSDSRVVGGKLVKGRAVTLCVWSDDAAVRAPSMPSTSVEEPTPAPAKTPAVQPAKEPARAADPLPEPPVVTAPPAPEPAPSSPRAPIALGPSSEVAQDPSAAYAVPAEEGRTTPGYVPAVLPKKPNSKTGLDDLFPEEGERVNHFMFGACVVISSDGERLKLQQDKDSRVREVALSVLKVQAPKVNADGVRVWELSRKN